jgi:adenylosuccinate lyase
MENVALWHERDISHSSAERIIIPDACTLLHYVLDIFNKVMAGLEVDEERMLSNLYMTGGLIFSQRILLALIEKGVGRQEAYQMVQRNAKKVWSTTKHSNIQEQALIQALSEDNEVTRYLSYDELVELTKTEYYVKYINTTFARLKL